MRHRFERLGSRHARDRDDQNQPPGKPHTPKAATASRSSSTVASDARWPHSIVDVVGAGSARWAPQTSTRIQKDRAAGPVTVSQLQCHACFIQQTRAHADQSNDGAHDASCRVDRDARSPATCATVARYQDIRAQSSQQNTESVCTSVESVPCQCAGHDHAQPAQTREQRFRGRTVRPHV